MHGNFCVWPKLSRLVTKTQHHICGHEVLVNRFNPKVASVYRWCMISLINTNYGIIEFTCEYQIRSTNQILIFGGYVEVKVSVYPQVFSWINTILDYIDTRIILSRYEGFCMICRPKQERKKSSHQNTHTHRYQKNVKSSL